MSQLSLLIVMVAALVVPLTMARFKISFIPNAVAEIVVGIVLGETGFNIVHTNADLTLLSSLGVIILLFLSGMEIDFDLFKPQPASRTNKSKGPSPVTLAGLGFTATVASALLLAVVLHYANLFNDIVLATILFSTIALGIVIAVRRYLRLVGQIAFHVDAAQFLNAADDHSHQNQQDNPPVIS